MASVFITTRILRSGQPRFVVRYRLGGKAAKLVHAGSFKTLEQAEEVRDRIMSAIAGCRVDLVRPPASQEEHVYFAQFGDLVKIGFSTDPEQRCKSLHAELLCYEGGGRRRELELHARFARLRVRGEWFQLDDELRGYIDTLRLKSKKAA